MFLYHHSLKATLRDGLTCRDSGGGTGQSSAARHPAARARPQPAAFCLPPPSEARNGGEELIDHGTTLTIRRFNMCGSAADSATLAAPFFSGMFAALHVPRVVLPAISQRYGGLPRAAYTPEGVPQRASVGDYLAALEE